MRYFISHEGSYKPSKSINKYLMSEKNRIRQLYKFKKI